MEGGEYLRAFGRFLLTRASWAAVAVVVITSLAQFDQDQESHPDTLRFASSPDYAKPDISVVVILKDIHLASPSPVINASVGILVNNAARDKSDLASSTLTLDDFGNTNRALTFKLRANPSNPSELIADPQDVNLYLYGITANFPFDTYSQSDLFPVATLKGPLGTVNGLGEHDGGLEYWLVNTTRGWVFGKSDLSTPAGDDPEVDGSAAVYDIGDRKGRFEIKRPPSYFGFVLTVSLAPLLIALSFGYRRLTARVGARDETSPLELASALLAVLALRQVLVPQEIGGFTMLDRILAIELTLVIAITVESYLHVPRRRDADERRSEGFGNAGTLSVEPAAVSVEPAAVSVGDGVHAPEGRPSRSRWPGRLLLIWVVGRQARRIARGFRR